jgi:hypothetical protein
MSYIFCCKVAIRKACKRVSSPGNRACCGGATGRRACKTVNSGGATEKRVCRIVNALNRIIFRAIWAGESHYIADIFMNKNTKTCC